MVSTRLKIVILAPNVGFMELISIFVLVVARWVDFAVLKLKRISKALKQQGSSTTWLQFKRSRTKFLTIWASTLPQAIAPR